MCSVRRCFRPVMLETVSIHGWSMARHAEPNLPDVNICRSTFEIAPAFRHSTIKQASDYRKHAPAFPTSEKVLSSATTANCL
jgi:hypothetical protein